ncbi:MAG: SBBP repeat-containing protein [Elusimicrobia bacterium]|nr:SBBP repeat-containing protein [Elusimicrobiota bacterium]
MKSFRLLFICLKYCLFITLLTTVFCSAAKAEFSLDSSAQFNAPSTGLGSSGDDYKKTSIAKDSSGNIFIAGFKDNAAVKQLLVLKYSSNFVLVSSATFAGPGGRSLWASNIAVNNSGNVIIAGTQYNGTDFDYVTFRYDNNLVLLSSAVYDSGNDDSAYGVALDSSSNIFITGSSYQGAGTAYDYFTIKYSSGLSVVISSCATDAGAIGNNDYARAICCDSQQNVIVTGYITDSGGKSRCCTIKYDNNLVFQRSSTSNLENGSTEEKAVAISVDSNDLITIAGTSKISGLDFFIFKYTDSTMNFSNAYKARFNSSANNNDAAYSLAISSITGNIYLTGGSSDGTNYSFCTLKYDNGLNYLSKILYNNPGKDTIAYDVIFDSSSNILVSGGTDNSFLTLKYKEKNTLTVLINPAAASSPTLSTVSGNMILDILAGTFAQQLYISLDAATIPSGPNGNVNLTSIGLIVTKSLNIQPLKEITITINYTDSDVAGLDENKLCIAYFDTYSNSWIPFNSIPYPDQNKVSAKTTHFSLFALAQNSSGLGTIPIKSYPSPYNPKKSAVLMQIENLPNNSTVKIYTFAGELVKTIDAGPDTIATWDGKNENGDYVSSGIYLMFADSPSGTKKTRIAIEK